MTAAEIIDSAICREARRDVAYYMRRLYRQQLTTTSGGNISFRFQPGYVAITPAALDKGRLRPAEIAVVTEEGENLTPDLPLSSETQMHLAILAARPDCQAVVHAHPATASAFTTTRQPIRCDLLAEHYALVGTPAFAPYARTGTAELAEIVADTARRADCILMENHGCTAVGDTLLRAFDRLELLEAAAQMTITTSHLTGVHTLTPDRCAALDALMGRTGPTRDPDA